VLLFFIVLPCIFQFNKKRTHALFTQHYISLACWCH